MWGFTNNLQNSLRTSPTNNNRQFNNTFDTNTIKINTHIRQRVSVYCRPITLKQGLHRLTTDVTKLKGIQVVSATLCSSSE